jgi:hypothetical protein
VAACSYSPPSQFWIGCIVLCVALCHSVTEARLNGATTRALTEPLRCLSYRASCINHLRDCNSQLRLPAAVLDPCLCLCVHCTAAQAHILCCATIRRSTRLYEVKKDTFYFLKWFNHCSEGLKVRGTTAKHSMSKRKGLSLDEKRDKVLEVFTESADVFLLKVCGVM